MLACHGARRSFDLCARPASSLKCNFWATMQLAQRRTCSCTCVGLGRSSRVSGQQPFLTSAPHTTTLPRPLATRWRASSASSTQLVPRLTLGTPYSDRTMLLFGSSGISCSRLKPRWPLLPRSGEPVQAQDSSLAPLKRRRRRRRPSFAQASQCGGSTPLEAGHGG